MTEGGPKQEIDKQIAFIWANREILNQSFPHIGLLTYTGMMNTGVDLAIVATTATYKEHAYAVMNMVIHTQKQTHNKTITCSTHFIL